MRITRGLSDTELLKELGVRIRETRLAVPMPQRELAARAGISLRTVNSIESGNDVSFLTVIKVMRVLNVIENMDSIIPEIGMSPIRIAEKQKPRKRAYARKAPADRWKWGDER